MIDHYGSRMQVMCFVFGVKSLCGLSAVGQQLQIKSSNIHPLFEHNFMLYVISAVILKSDDLCLPDMFKHLKSLTT